LRFAVLRPSQRRASSRSHGAPRRDIPGRAHVGVARVSAGGATEDRLALARLPVYLPTCRAALARESGINLLKTSGSFLLQAAYEYAPSGSGDTAVKPRFLANIPARILRCASVPLAGLQPGDREPYPLAPFRIAPRSGQPPLQAEQFPPLPLSHAGGMQKLTCRQRCADSYASIDPNDLPVVGRRDRIRNRCESDMPPPGAIHRHAIRLYPCRYGARPPESQPPHFRHPDFAGSPAEPMHVLMLDRNDPKSFIPACLPPRRLACRVPRVQTGLYGLGEIPQSLLLHYLGARSQPLMLGSGGGELSALLNITRCASAARMPVRVLLDGKVPCKPGMCTMVPQHGVLSGSGNQPVSRQANIVSTNADIYGEVERRVLRSGVFTSQS
jgi:hypothetical protein